ncbi:MAG: hypothetical protein AAGH88_13275 [Planctomycetota bacterium]
MKWMMVFFASLGLSMPALQGCTTAPIRYSVEKPVLVQQTVPGVGACQGLLIHDGSVWLYGDAETGVVRRLVFENGRLTDTGETYLLTQRRTVRPYTYGDKTVELNQNLLSHPTGLTIHPEFGCFIGDTIMQRGRIYHIDWDRLINDGNLDNAVLNTTYDDLAVNGCRPEFVRWGGRWLIATSDYGDQANQLRLYDPEKLAKAKKTSDPGVLVAQFPCGPFVQSMHWIDHDRTLVLAQNQTAGLGYRLTMLKFGQGAEAPSVERIIDLDYPEDELEGFGIAAPGWAVMTSAMRERNVSITPWPVVAE